MYIYVYTSCICIYTHTHTHTPNNKQTKNRHTRARAHAHLMLLKGSTSKQLINFLYQIWARMMFCVQKEREPKPDEIPRVVGGRGKREPILLRCRHDHNDSADRQRPKPSAQVNISFSLRKAARRRTVVRKLQLCLE